MVAYCLPYKFHPVEGFMVHMLHKISQILISDIHCLKTTMSHICIMCKCPRFVRNLYVEPCNRCIVICFTKENTKYLKRRKIKKERKFLKKYS